MVLLAGGDDCNSNDSVRAGAFANENPKRGEISVVFCAALVYRH